jgi:shikimate kinase
MNDATRALLLGRAITVWLNADIDTLADRVARKDNRPLLAGKDAREVLRELAAIRNPVYAQADIHVTSQSAPHAATVEEIVSAIRGRVSE